MVLLKVTTIWLLFLFTLSYGNPTVTSGPGTTEEYGPVANTFTIMTNYTGDSFNRSWTDYRDGFLTPKGNSWYGLEQLHQLTKADNGFVYQLIIALFAGNSDGISYSSCIEFKVDSEQQDYRVHCRSLDGYVETLIDNSTFSTYDRGSKKVQAGSLGFGWWFTQDQTNPLHAMNMALTKIKKSTA